MRNKLIINELGEYVCPPKCTTCCDSWFSSVELTEDEHKKLMEYGATRLYKENGKYHLRFITTKCEFLIKKKCIIYEEDFRPARCKKFICFDVNNKEGLCGKDSGNGF